MWVQALPVTAGAVAVAALRHMPVAIAVGHVAVLAETCIVVEPSGVTWAKRRGGRNAWAIWPAWLQILVVIEGLAHRP